MAYECFELDVHDHVAHLQLARPDALNAMNLAFWRELPEIIESLDAEAAARALVLSSTGRHFTAGMDLSVFGSEEFNHGQDRAATRGPAIYDMVRHLQRTMSCLENCRFPVLAAIQGGCVGGGVDLATACDMRYATEDAFFVIQEINIGMTADVGTFPRLARLVPDGVVRELSYTGRRMPAARAHEVGLVNQVFPDQGEMLAGVMEVAQEIAAKAPLAVYGSKRMLNYARDHSTEDTLDYIGVWNAAMLQPDAMTEASSASREKRPPKFADLPGRKVRP